MFSLFCFVFVSHPPELSDVCPEGSAADKAIWWPYVFVPLWLTMD